MKSVAVLFLIIKISLKINKDLYSGSIFMDHQEVMNKAFLVQQGQLLQEGLMNIMQCATTQRLQMSGNVVFWLELIMKIKKQ